MYFVDSSLSHSQLFNVHDKSGVWPGDGASILYMFSCLQLPSKTSVLKIGYE